MKKEGIKLETNPPYTPPQNGRVEREMRTIVECARSMLYDAETPKKVWAEAVNTAVYILNRTPTTDDKIETPYDKMYNKRPYLNHMKKFGCVAYMHIPESQRVKLDAKSQKMTFAGYEGNSGNYRLLDNENKKIKVSRNVVFNEEAKGFAGHG